MARFALAKYAGLILILSAGVAFIVAQPATLTPTPSPQPETEAPCQGSALIVAKAEIDALLRTFNQDVDQDPDAALASLYAVGEAYQQLALTCGYLPDQLDSLVIGAAGEIDLERVMVALDTLDGDPLRGQMLYNGEEVSSTGDHLSCSSCHEGGMVAPSTAGTWTRWDEIHSVEARFADYTFEQYTAESVLLPWDYFVSSYPEYTMPDFYPTQLSYQDLADLIAYLESQDQLLD